MSPMVVQKNTVIQDIWRIFFDRIKSTVTTTSITGPHTVTIQTYESNFSDKPFDDRTYYPVIIINPPTVPNQYWTAGKEAMNGTIEVEVYTYQSESADKFTSQIIDTIETYKGTLAANGLQRVRITGPDYDMVIRGTTKVHVRRVSFDFRFIYTKTNSF